MTMLDAAASEQFRRHGYAWLRGFFTEAGTRPARGWTDEMPGWPETPGRWMRYYERPGGGSGEKMLARVENFVPYHPGLAALFSSARLLGTLEDCCGEPVVLFKDKINFKLAGGAGFAPHQDAPAYVDFGVGHHLTLMAPVDPFTEVNGCLEVSRWDSRHETLPQNPDGTLRDGVMERWAIERLLAEPGTRSCSTPGCRIAPDRIDRARRDAPTT